MSERAGELSRELASSDAASPRRMPPRFFVTCRPDIFCPQRGNPHGRCDVLAEKMIS